MPLNPTQVHFINKRCNLNGTTPALLLTPFFFGANADRQGDGKGERYMKGLVWFQICWVKRKQ